MHSVAIACRPYLAMILFVALPPVAHLAFSADVPASVTAGESLPQAQRRMTAARDGLGRAQGNLREAEKRVKESEEAVRDAESRLEQARKRAQQESAGLETAKAQLTKAKEELDAAEAAIRRIYQAGRPKP